MSEDKSDKKINIHNLTMGDKIPLPRPKKQYFSVNPDKIEQPQGILSVFLDESIKYDSSKQDLAMYLGGYDEPEVEEGLKQYAYDTETPHLLAESCLEALCAISRRQNKLQSFIDDCKAALKEEGLEDEAIYNLEDYISFAAKKL